MPIRQHQPAPVPVTADNFVRAESDRTLRWHGEDGRIRPIRSHFREPLPIDKQVAARSNRDTLYSDGGVRPRRGPVTITLPDAGERFMSMIVIDEDHYVLHGGLRRGRPTPDQATIGTRYVLTGGPHAGRSGRPGDVDQVHALQDAIRGRPGRVTAGSRRRTGTRPASRRYETRSGRWARRCRTGGGAAGQPGARSIRCRHLIVTATAGAATPIKDAIYLNVTPNPERRQDRLHGCTVKDVPVDGFWSISVYNGEGYFERERPRRLHPELHHGEEVTATAR